DSPNNTVGGANLDVKNVISGNFGNGIFINGAGSSGSVVVNSFIGTNKDGTSAISLGNGGDGIQVLDFNPSSISDRIGIGFNLDLNSPVYGRNLISGSFGNGVHIVNSTHVELRGNYIGTDLLGLSSGSNLANALNGILVSDTANTADAVSNIIG